MEGKDIIALYWARSEEAIQATASKYGVYCGAIIRRVLGDGRDDEECLNDTWLGEAISAYLDTVSLAARQVFLRRGLGLGFPGG